MIKRLIETAALGILGSRIIPAALTGVMYSAAGVLSAQILCIALVGMVPLVVISSMAAGEEKPDVPSMRPNLVKAIPPRGADPRAEGFAPSQALRSVHFDSDRASIRPSERKVLEANVEWLKANRAYTILIEGGADPRGAAQHNLSLGERRAQAVRDYLVTRGISPERLTIASAGDAKPACLTTDARCMSLGRRADFLVKGLEKQAP